MFSLLQESSLMLPIEVFCTPRFILQTTISWYNPYSDFVHGSKLNLYGSRYTVTITHLFNTSCLTFILPWAIYLNRPTTVSFSPLISVRSSYILCCWLIYCYYRLVLGRFSSSWSCCLSPMQFVHIIILFYCACYWNQFLATGLCFCCFTLIDSNLGFISLKFSTLIRLARVLALLCFQPLFLCCGCTGVIDWSWLLVIFCLCLIK